MRTVRDVMCGVVEVLRTTESAEEAACYLAAHGEDAVPLCLADGRLAGVVSSRDIVAKVVAKGLDPKVVRVGELAEPGSAVGLDVNAPLDEAVAVMCHSRRARLPVTDGDRVVGLVTQRDAARALVFRSPWFDT
ncbi:MAG TPA: CBS domain-containing protein [Acidimicrobiales bacterium]|nr:CBS domain-containing protein [Acidimicrobiales bacterium]